MQGELALATDSLIAACATGVTHDPEAHEVREARFRGLMRAWWLDERPGWTESDWWEVPLRDDVRTLLWLPAGPHLAEALSAIGRIQSCVGPHADEASGPTPTPGSSPGWPCACMVVLAAAWEACGAWAAAGAACALVDCAGREEVTFSVPELGLRVCDPAREELANALRTSLGSMSNRIAGARELVDHPRLVALVATATISAWAARLVVREVEDLTDEQAALVVGEVCDKVLQRRDSGRRSWTSAEVGRAARRARLRVCPDADQEARQRAFAGRRVQVHPDRHGMATIVADLDATDAHRIHRRLTAIATGLSDPTDARTRDQIRADVLVDVLLGVARRCAHPESPGETAAGGSLNAGGRGPAVCRCGAASVECCAGDPTDGCRCEDRPDRSHGGARPEISVVMSLADILGMTDDPAHVPGLGPIPADLARSIAADSSWRAWITDASGVVVATGTRGYVPTAALARLVRAREPVCRMPGCRQAASSCDLDHTVAYPAGRTTAANLGPLCRRHHVMKTHGGWVLDPEPPEAAGGADPADQIGTDPGLDPPGPVAWSWRTPAGFTLRDHPDPPLATGS